MKPDAAAPAPGRGKGRGGAFIRHPPPDREPERERFHGGRGVTGHKVKVVPELSRPTRARSADEKHQRREEILQAAERLWTSTSYAELSMNQVAREAQLAKGTLYLYFSTKEELFMALLNKKLLGVLDDLARQLQAQPGRTPTETADLFADCAQENESLRRLLILAPLVLERNISVDTNVTFKKNLWHAAQNLLSAMPFEEKTSLRFLRHVYALVVGWQQITEPNKAIQILKDAGVVTVTLNFEDEFRLSLRAVANVLATETA